MGLVEERERQRERREVAPEDKCLFPGGLRRAQRSAKDLPAIGHFPGSGSIVGGGRSPNLAKEEDTERRYLVSCAALNERSFVVDDAAGELFPRGS